MATKDNTIGIYNTTVPAIMVFPATHEPKQYMKDGKAKGEPKYGGTFVFDPASPDIKGMKAKIASVARARWPGIDLSEIKLPLLKGDTLADKRKAKAGKDDADFMRGKIVMKANSKYPPGLATVEGGKIVDHETDVARVAAKGKFYGGVETLIQVNFVAYESDDDKKGVSAYLNTILSTGKGAKIGGARPSASQSFSGYVGTYSAENPMTDDDEIAF
jgi:Protein of unknown function (DUF2815)